nr:MAG TPA: hypothetical protein [Caudoviricetes sp.]
MARHGPLLILYLAAPAARKNPPLLCRSPANLAGYV